MTTNMFSYVPIEQALKRRDFAQAAALAQARLRAAPRDAEALRLLGAALSALGRRDDAIAAIRRAIALRPGDARAHNSLGAALHAGGARREAVAAFRRALEIAPDFAPAWQNLATDLMMLEDDEGALHAIGNLLRLQPNSLRAKIMRSDVWRNVRPGAEVAAEYRRIIAAHPDSGWPWFGMSNLKSVPFDADDIERMQVLLPKVTDVRERMSLLFALAKANEDRGRYAQVMEALDCANGIARGLIRWDAAAFGTGIDAVLAAFPSPHHAPDDFGEAAIFIVGLPRSGTTLVEQILSSHSQVAGGGEMEHLERTIARENQRRGKPLAEWAAIADTADWTRLGQTYLDACASRRADAARLTDKTPENWIHAGAALAMLPQARVINCRRDPVEAGLSCYKQLFSGSNQAFSYAISDIGAYWRDYDRATRRWRELFPQRVYDLSYENLQVDTENQVRRLLAFCGLEFEPACLRFHENRRSVNTVSSAQVREPMRRDTARADKYGALLDPLRHELGLPPWRPENAHGPQ
jgi:tetratricopeptide (TPR) repeat protein